MTFPRVLVILCTKNTSFDKEEEILANHNSFMSSMNSQFDEKNDDLSIVYLIPKSTSINIEKGILLDLLRTVYNYDYFVFSHTEDTKGSGGSMR